MAAESHPKLFHRFPFVLFDRALSAGSGASAAERVVSIDDALHEGRAGTTFVQTLLMEAMAQTAALFAEEEGRTRSGMLVGLRRVRFGRPPRPGDRLRIEATLVQRFGDLVRVEGRVSESGETLAEGEILISLAGGGGDEGLPGEGRVGAEEKGDGTEEMRHGAEPNSRGFAAGGSGRRSTEVEP